MSISDSVANNLIASISQHLFWVFFIRVLGGGGFFCCFFFFFSFPEVTFVEERFFYLASSFPNNVTDALLG